MSNPTSKFSPETMNFTDLLNEYLQEHQRLASHSEDERRRLAEIMYEINLRCPPKNNH